jgi:hypothetical protein
MGVPRRRPQWQPPWMWRPEPSTESLFGLPRMT